METEGESDRHTQIETEGESDRHTQMEAEGESDRHTQMETEEENDIHKGRQKVCVTGIHTQMMTAGDALTYIYIHTQTQIVGKTVIMIY